MSSEASTYQELQGPASNSTRVGSNDVVGSMIVELISYAVVAAGIAVCIQFVIVGSPSPLRPAQKLAVQGVVECRGQLANLPPRGQHVIWTLEIVCVSLEGWVRGVVVCLIHSPSCASARYGTQNHSPPWTHEADPKLSQVQRQRTQEYAQKDNR